MISYFTKMYQAVPSLIGLHDHLGGIFVTTRPSTKQAIQRVHSNVEVKLMRQWCPRLYAGYHTLMDADLIVTGSPNNSLLKQFPGKKAMVFHGTFAPMSVEEIQRMVHFDYLCTIGPRMRNIVEQAGMLDKVIETGYLPFLHYPQKNTAQKTALLQTLGMSPTLPLILYLPAGRPIGSWDFLAEKLVQQLPAKQFNLILRPHPSHSVSSRHRDRVGFKKLQHLTKQRQNTILDLTNQDLSVLYAFADLVISDGTSPAEESLYYDVPQLLVESPAYGIQQAKQVLLDKGIDSQHIEQVLAVYDIGPTLSVGCANICAVVESALAMQMQYAKARLDYFEFVFGEKSTALSKQQKLITMLADYKN